jgi:hypothetical protein
MVAGWEADVPGFRSATITGAVPYSIMSAALPVFSLSILGTYDEIRSCENSQHPALNQIVPID